MGVGEQRHPPGRFTPGKDLVPIVDEAGWAQGRSGRVRKILPPTGIRSLNHPARSESIVPYYKTLLKRIWEG
jgi:hypothetical protein